MNPLQNILRRISQAANDRDRRGVTEALAMAASKGFSNEATTFISQMNATDASFVASTLGPSKSEAVGLSVRNPGTGGGYQPGVIVSVSALAAPAYKSAGSIIEDSSGRTVPWPTHVAGDYALLVGVQTNIPSGSNDTLTTPAGFTLIDGVQGTSTNGLTVYITLWWARATSSSMTSPVIAQAGFGPGSALGQIFTFTGAGNVAPDVSSKTGGSTTSLSVSGATTSAANRLIVMIATLFNDTANFPTLASEANTDLTSVTEQADSGHTLAALSGQAQGIAMATGVKAAAGVYGNTTATWTEGAGNTGTYTSWAAMTVALVPG